MAQEISDFERDVIERSRTQPVLVDFWAEWCGPCRALGPVLEKLEAAAAGAWTLAKVDVDRNQPVAAAYGVQSIPVVKLFVDGAVVGEFTGALPESQVARWLDAHLPRAEKEGLGEALELVRAGRLEAAVARLEALLAEDPGQEPVRALLAQLTVFGDPVRAAELVDRLRPDSEHRDVAENVRGLAAALTRDRDALAEHPVREAYRAGLDALAGQDFENALERFIEVLGRDRAYDEEGARKACIAIFDFVGREHPLAKGYRRRFQSALN